MNPGRKVLKSERVKGLVGMFGFVVVAVVVGFWTVFLTAEAFRNGPLYGFETQTIVNGTPTNRGHFIAISEGGVEVDGQKCSRETTPVAGEFGWNSALPGGYSTPRQTGVGQREEGCFVSRFFNPWPEGNEEEGAISLVQFVSRNKGVASFVISGEETPNRGFWPRTAVWRTETFTIYDDAVLTLEEAVEIQESRRKAVDV